MLPSYAVAACVSVLLIAGCSHASGTDGSHSDSSSATSSNPTVNRDTMLFKTTAGFCEGINAQQALAEHKRYTPHGDMGQTEVGQIANSGDAVEMGNGVQTQCRDINGDVSTQTALWVQDQRNGASGYIRPSAISQPAVQRPASASANVKSSPPRGYPPVTPPPLVAAEGYMVALNDSLNNHKPGFDEPASSKCANDAAHYYLEQGQRAFDSGRYRQARTDAWTAYEYAECGSNRSAKEDGDAELLLSRSEAKLGILHGAKEDASNAASSYSDCQGASDVYSDDDRNYCTSQMGVANDVAHGGE
jgi:hypothetical protein